MATPVSRRPFRFGVQINRADSATAWQEKARKAEALGYDVLAIADHFGDRFAYAPALAVAAAATSTIRLGTLVLQNPLRHPALHAMEATTLDVLSDGRFELGLGAGGSLMSDFEQTGMRFAPPGVRAGELEESVHVIQALLRGEKLTFNGKHYQFNDFELFPKPVQPHMPLLIGAGGPRLLRLAAREADIVSVLPLMHARGGDFHLEESTAEAFKRKVDLLRDTAGPRFDRIEIHMLVQRFLVTDQARGETEHFAERWQLSTEEAISCPYALIGSVEQIVEKIERQRDELGLSYYVIFEPDIDNFVPVMRRLKGE